MNIYLGADHAGFKLKEQVKKYLKNSEYKIFDLGAKRFIKTDDYPDYARKVASKVSLNGGFGILFCGSGHGMCITANKIKGVRAVTVSSVREAMMVREHNNANVLCLSGWQISLKKAKKIIDAFLKTPFSKEKRHIRRLEKIKRIEETFC
jgi:ribose 5-phosphate isomerase B